MKFKIRTHNVVSADAITKLKEKQKFSLHPCCYFIAVPKIV
jgi:hypothetical protein